MKQTIIILAVAFVLLLPASVIAQTARADNKPSQSITFHAIPSGPLVMGIFQGRPPSKGLVKQLNIDTDNNNPKIKCTLVLYRNSDAAKPGNYTLSMVGGGPFINEGGNHYRGANMQGAWEIVKGIPGDNNAEVYKLQLPASAKYLYLLKGDDNVLFVLDENKQPMAGDEDFSYTLNRVQLVPGTK